MKDIKVAGFSLKNYLFIGIAKQVTEKALNPIVGNSSYMSGATKLALGYGADKFISGKGTFSNALIGGLVIDGVEDIAVALLRDTSPYLAKLPFVGGMFASSEVTSNNGATYI